MRAVGLLMIGAALACSPAAAQDWARTSPQSQIAGEIDKYLEAPRSAATYRALSNMGDPTFMAGGRPFRGDWDSALLKALDVPFTRCRWSYSDQVYRARIARLGGDHPYVRQWLKVQKAVFSRCHGYEKKAGDPIPAPMAAADERIARIQAGDREYQKAAAIFYDGRLADARIAFAAIAGRGGEHQAAAKLMIASIEAGSEPDGFADAKATPATIGKAERLLNDPAAKPMQANAHELVGWIGATADTIEARRAQVKVTLDALALPLETIARDPQAEARWFRAAEDLPRLFTDFKEDGWWLTGAIPEGYHGSRAVAEAAKTNALAAFALTRRPRTNEPPVSQEVRDAAEKQFAADRADRDAWRVALLHTRGEYAPPAVDWAEIDALLARVAARPIDHDVALLGFLFDQKIRAGLDGPGPEWSESRRDRAVAIARLASYPYKQSIHFQQLYSHGLNVLVGAADIESARRLRDLIEPQQGAYGWLADSDLLLLLAEDEAAMVRVIAKRDAGASTLLNRLPVRSLARLAGDGNIDTKVRKRFARVAWTRAYLLGRRVPKDLDRLMRSLNPEIARSWKSRPGAGPRDHALLLDLLSTPGMNPRIESRSEPDNNPLEMDYYQHSLNNWWCSRQAVDQAVAEEQVIAESVNDVPRPALETLLAKSYVWKSLDRREREALAAVAKAPQSLSDGAIEWGRKASARRPKGADEALALAVRSTRYGCQFSGGHGVYSKAAWDLLHQKFPASDAAKRTRWWFDCKHFTYGCDDSRRGNGHFVDRDALEAELKRQREVIPASERTDAPRAP